MENIFIINLIDYKGKKFSLQKESPIRKKQLHIFFDCFYMKNIFNVELKGFFPGHIPLRIEGGKSP